MDKYYVKLLTRALRDLEGIHSYIDKTLLVPEIAEKMISALEQAIFSLEELPERGVERNVGIFAGRGYRQLFVKNYTIIYRTNKEKKQVIIITICYSPSQFYK